MLTIAASVAFFSALALAETWSGKLFDAVCMEQQKGMQVCSPTATTTAFLILVDGKSFKLDDTGNTKAAEALKNRADRTAPGSPEITPDVTAKVSGTKDGEIIKVDTIEVK
jgi:hypothetical protein